MCDIIAEMIYNEELKAIYNKKQLGHLSCLTELSCETIDKNYIQRKII